MFLRHIHAKTAGLMPFAVALILAGTAVSQEVSPEEGAAYTAWHAASQANDTTKAMAAATAYLKEFPSGQYAGFLKQWLGKAHLAALDAAIKASRTADMLKVGQEILAVDPDNLNVLYALATGVRSQELLASPANYAHAAEAAAFGRKAIALIEKGQTPGELPKETALAYLYQVLGLCEAKNGNSAQAIGFFEKSTALASGDVQVAGRNLLAVLAMRQASYADAAKSYNSLPEADRGAAEPTPDVKAALDKVNVEADGLIDVAARFVAFATVKNLPQSTRDRVFGLLENVYKTRHPEDATGLQALVDEKVKALGGGSGD